VSGELDLAASSALRSAVGRAPIDGGLEIDLRRLTFVDADGVAGLVAIVRSGREVRLMNPSRAALRAMVDAGAERELMNA
jgi:hypothetical protein